MNTNEIDIVKALNNIDKHFVWDGEKYTVKSGRSKALILICTTAATEIERLQKDLDAAVADIKQCFKLGECANGEPIYDIGICKFCKKRESDDLCDCGSGAGNGGFEWRGRESEGT